MKNSQVRGRIHEQGKLFSSSHIIVFSSKKHGIRAPYEDISDNVRLYPTRSFSRWFYMFDAVRIGKKILSEIKNEDIRITTQDPFESGIVGAVLSRRFKIPFQVQIHTDFLSSYFKKESLLNHARVVISRFVLPRASCVRVVSKRIVTSLKNNNFTLSPNVHVLPVLVGEDGEKKEEKSSFDLHKKYGKFKTIILVVSRLEKEKNIVLALDALSIVLKNEKEVGMVIVGEGREKENLAQRAQNLGIEENVIFEGWKNDLAPYYKSADIFLNTSHYEGYGMTLAEAAINGLPTVTSDVGLVGEILLNEKEILVYETDNIKSLSNQLIRLIQDWTLRARLASSARKSMSSTLFSSEEYSRLYISLLTSCKK